VKSKSFSISEHQSHERIDMFRIFLTKFCSRSDEQVEKGKPGVLYVFLGVASLGLGALRRFFGYFWGCYSRVGGMLGVLYIFFWGLLP
jgi:hypothetical protein